MTCPSPLINLDLSRPMWVFGYGSLIWSPDFPVAERRLATARGWRRSFCLQSIHHRGTPEAPGLVLALDEDATAECQGLALRVAPGAESETLAMLRERELVTSAYLERELPLLTREGESLTALAYVIDPSHAQYTGAMDPEEQAHIILRAKGGRGFNRDYLWSTVAHLEELGVQDPELAALAARVRALASE